MDARYAGQVDKEMIADYVDSNTSKSLIEYIDSILYGTQSSNELDGLDGLDGLNDYEIDISSLGRATRNAGQGSQGGIRGPGSRRSQGSLRAASMRPSRTPRTLRPGPSNQSDSDHYNSIFEAMQDPTWWLLIGLKLLLFGVVVHFIIDIFK